MPIRSDQEMICRRWWANGPGTENGWEIKEMARGGYCCRAAHINHLIPLSDVRSSKWVVGSSSSSSSSRRTVERQCNAVCIRIDA